MPVYATGVSAQNIGGSMAGMTADSFRSAWNALWNTGGAYDIRTAMESGARKGLIWFRPLSGVSFPATGPIVVCNSEPWGVVTVDFTANEVSQFQTAVSDNVEFSDNKFTATLHFTELKLAGSYLVRKGVATGSAVKLAATELGGAVSDDDPPNIVLAKSYQTELIQNPQGSGRTLVGSYYDNNEAYVQCFTNQNFVNAWNGTTYTTNGKNTAYFAAQTSNAAQPANKDSVNVNADPDYQVHSFAMQNFVTVTCVKQGNKPAGDAAATFSNYAGPQSNTPQTVTDVVNTVSSTQPPSPDQLVGVSRWQEPWMAGVLEKIKPILDAIGKEEDDVARGIILRDQTERPIASHYRSYFPSGPLTLTGSIHEDANGGVTVECTRISGSTPDADIKLGIFPGTLHSQLQSELDKAGFLRSVLAQKAILSLSGPAFLGYMSRMLTLAAGEKLGPVNR
jgi:hypothetical protein